MNRTTTLPKRAVDVLLNISARKFKTRTQLCAEIGITAPSLRRVLDGEVITYQTAQRVCAYIKQETNGDVDICSVSINMQPTIEQKPVEQPIPATQPTPVTEPTKIKGTPSFYELYNAEKEKQKRSEKDIWGDDPTRKSIPFEDDDDDYLGDVQPLFGEEDE